MMQPKRFLFPLATALLLLAAISLRASDTVGVYCLIDKVVLQPNDTSPTAIQVWGAFSFAVPRGTNGVQPKPAGSFGNAEFGDVYGPVQKGYLFYSCPAGKETTCRNEWADLRSVAGKHAVVGIGGRHVVNGTVRATTAAPAAPDPYPLNVGVVKIGTYVRSLGETPVPNQTQYPDMIAALDAALRGQ